jgi:hypothetical protein
MPYKDKTGPQGQGPVTGRGFGPCVYGGFGGGMGFGRGFGGGFRRWPTPSKAQVKQDLDSYKKDLEDELAQVKEEQKRLEEDR